jgi:hypothetical protein
METTEAPTQSIPIPTAHNSSKRLVEYIELGLIGLGFLALFVCLPRRYFADGNVRFRAILALVQHGTVSNTSYSLVGPFFSIPLFVLDHFAGDGNKLQQRYNVFLCAAIFLITYLLLRKRMDTSILRKFFLIFITTSIFPNQSTFFGGEAFTALLVGMGILVALLISELGGWLAVVLGVVNAPASVLGLGLVTLRYLLAKKRLRYAFIFIAGAGLIGLEAWLRRGSPLNSGYGNQPFSTPFLAGIYSILLSSGKGIFLFAPALLLPLKNSLFQVEGKNKEKIYSAYKLWLYFLAGLVLIYASWWAWSGGWFWGPRFFLFAAIPASFVLAVRLRKPGHLFLSNLLTLLVLAYSLWVGINGAVFDQGYLGNTCIVNNYAQISKCEFLPTYSVLWYPFISHPPVVTGEKIYIAISLLIFLYLALPLFAALRKQGREGLAELRQGALNFKAWHL